MQTNVNDKSLSFRGWLVAIITFIALLAVNLAAGSRPEQSIPLQLQREVAAAAADLVKACEAAGYKGASIKDCPSGQVEHAK